MARLHPCPSCARHVRGSETACPFCGAAIEVASAAPKAGPALTRAEILFASATAVAACTSGGPDDPNSSSSSSGSTSSSSSSSSSSGDPVAVYGPAPVDAGDASRDGAPVALYGPAPVDAGDG